jgi:glycosyltransferase involved in cell wall biosynthesis
MIKISGIQTISNAVSLGYPFIEAALSILPIVNEVLINDGGSEDETPFYLEKLKKTFPEKIRLFNKRYHPSDHWETIDECINYLISQAKGDWIFEIFGDEIWHEKNILKIKKTVEDASKEGFNSIRTICYFSIGFQKGGPYEYRNVRIVRKLKNLNVHWGGDDFQIGDSVNPAKGFTLSNVPPELVTNIVSYNLCTTAFPENVLKRAETIATFFAKKDEGRQRGREHFKANPPQKQEPNPEAVKQLPAIIQGLAGLDKYRVREELFDKKFLKKLTGLNYK